ncbi:hypothetical protein C9E85_00735 [Plesiomonas shigelloides]|uniref:hypothetical protein n=1 Tax=Plesiomonas shigelloides TaxID=703 RepID=UPI000D583B98|nr:hypothetical protein [Plesiomonas shigelloides]PVU67736.1 hypothetical protein C9E85_00735 [Plesiomonas shigelloides]
MKSTVIPNIKNSTDFSFMAWAELSEYVARPKASRCASIKAAKERSPLIAAHNAKTRLKAEAEQAEFSLLRADLDDNTQGSTPETIAAALLEVGIQSFLIYSTLSHTPDAPRYRVLVELVEAINFDTWAMLQFELAEMLGSDPCVNRPAQFMLLPTTIKDTVTSYQKFIGNGNALTPDSAFWKNAQVRAEAYQNKATSTDIKLNSGGMRAFKRPYNERLIGNQVSIIEAVNLGYSWSELLAQYGYKRKALNAWVAPESQSKTAGVHILASHTDGKRRIYSHHSSDPCCGRLLDKFDLIALRSYGGDYTKAVREVAERCFPDLHKHNRDERRINAHNEQMANMRNGGQ